MKKLYRKLTKEQKARGVVFSSTLVYEDKDDTRADVYTHEVIGTPEGWIGEPQREKIEQLKDDKFFNNSPYKYNLIRE